MRPGIYRAAAALLLAALLSACAGPPRLPLNKLSEAKPGETIVVGRVEIVPPLAENEQKLTVGSGYLKDQLILITSDKFRRLTAEPTPGEYTGRIEARLDKDFTVRSSNKPFYILAGGIMTNGEDGQMAWFPGGLEVPIRPGDKAIYIGTLRYYRNEFMDVKKTVLVDDYARANAEFKKTYGARYSLRKALVRPVR
ncbi:MAG TPA: hypothetical protein VKC56_05580 [Gallionellaceae bacterium]|nr:hypothetical protein [Gallionellaceae bacterium]